MVAQLFLVVHDTEIIVVASAEQALRDNLILALPTLHHPDIPSTGPKTKIHDLLSFDQCNGWWKAFLEDLGEEILLFNSEGMSLAEFL